MTLNPENTEISTLMKLTNNGHVGLTGGEGVTIGVLNVDNVEGTGVLLLGHDSSNSTGVTTTSDHAQVSDLKGDNILKNIFVGLAL